jgi:hypothetical protein
VWIIGAERSAVTNFWHHETIRVIGIVDSLHQENSNRVAASLEPDAPDTSTLPESEWRHNTLPMS